MKGLFYIRGLCLPKLLTSCSIHISAFLSRCQSLGTSLPPLAKNPYSPHTPSLSAFF